MNDFWLLYLLARVDAAKEAASGVVVLTGIALVCVIIGCLVAADFDQFKSKEVAQERKAERSKLLRKAKKASMILPILIVALVLTPSKNDLLFIYGGSAILEAVKSPRAQSIGEKTLSAVEKWIDENTKEVGK